MIEENQIIEVFKQLNSSNLDYLLLRNIDQELPGKLKKGKDIDLLVRKSDFNQWLSFFNTLDFKVIQHPLRNDVFLYETDPFIFLLQNKSGIIVDFNFQLCVRSLDKGQWIPLDEKMQDSAWANKRFEKASDDFGYWTLSHNDEFITLVSRSIFDKKEFQKGYINRINELFPKINIEDVKQKMNLVFFKYTPFLLEQVASQEYDTILSNYLSFKDY